VNNQIFETYAPLHWAVGLPVIPLQERAKKPAIGGWSDYGVRMPDEGEQREWLHEFPTSNIGLPFGPASNLCAIDIDTDDQELIAAIRELLPESSWVRVGKKGMGLAYRWDGQPTFRLKGRDGMILELLGQGCQMVLPPSIHPETGSAYAANSNLWEVYDQLPSLNLTLERDLRDLLAPQGVGPGGATLRTISLDPSLSSSGNTNRYSKWVAAELQKRAKTIANTLEGDRNIILFREAAAMANHVAAAGLDWEPVAQVLRAGAITAGLEDDEIAGTLASAWRKGSETPTEWITVSQEWAYLVGPDVYRHTESGSIVKPGAFSIEFSRLNPHDKLSFHKFLTAYGLIAIVQDIAFEPSRAEALFERGGRTWLNTYKPSNVRPEEGDPQRFVDYLDYLVPNQDEREHLLKMLAHLVRNPGQKLGHALLLSSKVHGIGKSTLVNILIELMGPKNCRKATSEELASQYQSYLDGKLLVVVEELDLGSGLRVYNKLKDVITAEQSPMRKLYENTREIENFSTFFFLSNLDVPLIIEPSDRRFHVIQSPAQKRDPGYWTEFNDWWRCSLGIIRWYLDQVDLGGFDRFAPPPMTDAKAALIARGRNPVVQDLLEMIEDRTWPFHVDIVTRQQVQEGLRRRHPQIRRSQVDAALDDIGAFCLGQHRLPPGIKGVLGNTAEKPTLWAIRHHNFWQAADPIERAAEYLADQSRLDGIPVLPEEIGLLPMSRYPVPLKVPNLTERRDIQEVVGLTGEAHTMEVQTQ